MANLKHSRAARNAAIGFLATGAALGASALYTRWRTRQAERQHPPHGQFIEVDRVRLHYIDRGEGPPVVLLHGNGSMIEDFESSGLIDALAKTNRVIAFDRPGYGYSDRPDYRNYDPRAQAALLRQALLRLRISRPVIVGHSWGTMVAMWMGLMNPADVRGLVLMSGYYYPSLRLDVPFASIPAVPGIGTLMRYSLSPVLTRLMWRPILRRLFGPPATPQRFEREYPTWMALRPTQLEASGSESMMMIGAARELTQQYARLKVPVTLLAGEADRLVTTQSQTERLHGLLRTSTLQVVPGAGHMLHHEALNEVVVAIRTALSVEDQPLVYGSANTTGQPITGVPHGQQTG
ncbi:alpha/beta fold hydrolase [Noviherbaspirillum pedocola]|uniref:Alpha/beta hydrolase n=1 Tax=Noviherbaspirillum pedocola TaxID=2801341 RepID=A0A934W6K3_9BURK|nr:alpha/beta hydrolase [Noviherbaspirillum pedocola]MBK4734473.1 alpha/beta hydrolase [Noviherbaspirillum pedocola]